MLPQAIALRPARCSRCAVQAVVVVLPLVPGTASSGPRAKRAASSISEMTGIAPSERHRTGRRLDVASVALCLLANYLLRAASNCAGIAATLYLASLHSRGIAVKAEIIGIASLLYYLMELSEIL